MDIDGYDITTWLHIRSEMENQLSNSLTERVEMEDVNVRETSNAQAVRWAARAAAAITDMHGDNPTAQQVHDFMNESCNPLVHGHGLTVEDVGVIEAYVNVIFGFDPIDPFGDLLVDD